MSGQYNQNLRRKAFDHIFNGTAWTPQTWIVPYLATPDIWDAGTYPVQISTTQWTNNTDSGSDYLVTATVNVQTQWDAMNAGTYNGISVYEAETATAGELIAYTPFAAPVIISPGASLRVPANAIVITFENTVV